MTAFTKTIRVGLAGLAAFLAPSPGQALPAFSPLLRPAPLAAFLTPQENVLAASVLPASAPYGADFASAALPPPLGAGLFWDRTLDPSLHLTDWGHVFDVAALGSFDVPLRDDPAERANVLLSAQAVDNVVVAPDAEFSFNDQVGERTPERGFQDGLMFDQGRVVRGTGGGICLVATGLYNAALQAGLEIVERHPHSGTVSYAQPGCDAGIVYGQEDLKFRNTTPRPLVIRAQPNGDVLSIQLFGQTPPPNSRVLIKPTSFDTIPFAVVTNPDPTLPPGQSVVDQKPRSGYRVVVTRFWLQGRHVVRREVVARETRAPRNEIKRVALPPVVPPVVAPVPGDGTLLPGQLGPVVPTGDDGIPTPGASRRPLPINGEG